MLVEAVTGVGVVASGWAAAVAVAVGFAEGVRVFALCFGVAVALGVTAALVGGADVVGGGATTAAAAATDACMSGWTLQM